VGAWGVRAFEDDAAADWAFELAGCDDLSAVEDAFADVEAAGDGYLEQDPAVIALAACEVVARLRGRHGYADPYTEPVDAWVAAHPLEPSPELCARADAAITRILGPDSELRELWDEADGQAWRSAVEELHGRVRA
jgi:hypothetical protein